MTHKISIKNRAGFSLIEVMVATLILLIIVLMIGSIFRQATSAWDTGYARAEGGMIVRGVVGSIQRELSTAVDGRLYYYDVWGPRGNIVGGDGKHPIEVTSDTISFICEKESTGTGDSFVREHWAIVYKWEGKEMNRAAYPLRWDHANELWALGEPVRSTIYSDYSKDKKDERRAAYRAEFKFDLVSRFDAVRENESTAFEDDFFWNIPYVTIKVDLYRTSSFSGLEVRSWGRDGTKDTEDDIIVQ